MTREHGRTPVVRPDARAMARGLCRLPLIVLLLAAAARGSGAQQAVPGGSGSAADRTGTFDVSAALAPDTATVGDMVRAAVRVRVPAGARVEFPDSLPLEGDLESAGRRSLESRESGDGRVVTAVYPLRSWRPGVDTLPAVPFRMVFEGGAAREGAAALPPLVVRSVLPPDTAGLEARPPKDVLGPNRAWWTWLIVALLVLLAAAALIWWLRRQRQRRPAAVALPVPPRQRALAELDALRRERLIEQGELEDAYARVSHTARSYLAALDPSWTMDRTTSELVAAMVGLVGAERAARARSLLREADRVKFARSRPGRDQAERFWSEVRGWVEAFSEPHAEPEHDTAGGRPERGRAA